MNYNYHTHTYRCRHARGTAEEYILKAIEGGIKYLGFAEHFPYTFPDGQEGKSRPPVSEAEEYVSELRSLREKYKDKIELAIGFEMEYYPTYFEDMLTKAKGYGAEYLILGHHFLHEEHPVALHVNRPNDRIEDLKEFVSYVVMGIESGVFTYVAHPDVFNFTGDTQIYKNEMRKICRAATKSNTPLEINFLGIRGNRIYPNEIFWEMAGEEKSPVTFGCDSHGINDAYDDESFVKAMSIVTKYNLNYIGKPNLKLLPISKEGGE